MAFKSAKMKSLTMPKMAKLSVKIPKGTKLPHLDLTKAASPKMVSKAHGETPMMKEAVSSFKKAGK